MEFHSPAVLIPNTEDIKEILKDKESSLSPQGSATKMKPEDIFLESDEEKVLIFSKAVDQYLLDVLDISLNKVILTAKEVKEMDEKQINSYLKSLTESQNSTGKYDINVPTDEEILIHATPNAKSNVHIFILKDNSTVLGTMSILDDLSKLFNLPQEKSKADYLPFDYVSGNFDAVSGRSHFELLPSQQSHVKYMKNIEVEMRSSEKTMEDFTGIEVSHDENDNDDEKPEEYSHSEAITLERERRRFENEDKPFWESYNLLNQELLNVTLTNSEESYIKSVENMKNRKAAALTDHLKRTMLHVAVEKNHDSFAKYLVDLGLNVNAREGCGMTPLSIAVLKRNSVLCSFLVKSGAVYSGPLFTSVPSPLYMAEKLKLDEIQHIFEHDKAVSEEEDLFLQAIDKTLCKGTVKPASGSAGSDLKDCNRTCQGFVTPLVGDVGTCKTNNAAMERSASYHWVGLCPGDLHNKGYFCEAIFKVHGSSGFHYLWYEILRRKKITSAVFKKKKFQESNLTKIREAVRDACRSYAIAAALEFAGSHLFLSREEFMQTENVNLLILSKFKEWLSQLSESDVAFRHRASAILFYGPLQSLYDAAISYGDGVAREVVYHLLVPVYAQL